MYDIETDTLLDLVGLFYFCSLPFYMCLASVVLFFFSLFLILIDTGAVYQGGRFTILDLDTLCEMREFD